MVSTIGSGKAKKIKAGNSKSKTGRRNDLTLAHKYEVIKTAERERNCWVYVNLVKCLAVERHSTDLLGKLSVSKPEESFNHETIAS